jgi:hypothetical protein
VRNIFAKDFVELYINKLDLELARLYEEKSQSNAQKMDTILLSQELISRILQLKHLIFSKKLNIDHLVISDYFQRRDLLEISGLLNVSFEEISKRLIECDIGN